MKRTEYHRLALSLLDSADKFKPIWNWLAARVMPRTQDVINGLAASADKKDLSSVASESMHTLAAAHSNYITPSTQTWFKFVPRNKQEAATYEKWYSNASEVCLQELARSNFYTEVQECYLNRVLYGTALMLCEVKRGGGLKFKNIPVGTFGIAENSDGVIDTVCRRFKLSAHAAVDQWAKRDARGNIVSYGNLPTEIQRAYERPEDRYKEEEFSFLHLVMPRTSCTLHNAGEGLRDENGKSLPTLIPAKKRAFASIYLFDGRDYPVLEEGGYEEFPYLATRFLKWPGTVWGYAPALKCKSALDSLMKLENNMDILADLAAFPRILKLAEQVGEIDFRAGGQTVVSQVAAEMGYPKEWGTQGRYDVGKDRIEAKEKQILSAFHIPFLLTITTADRPQMTATEVTARQEEQALSFSPTMSQFSSDFSPFLYRIFAVSFRQGLFNAADNFQPDKLLVRAEGGAENYSVAIPQVHYMGRINQAIEKSQRQGIESILQTIQEFVHATGDVSVLDYLDLGKAFKYCFKATSAPADVLVDDKVVIQKRTAREKLAMAQAQMQMAADGAGAVKNLAGAK